MSAIRRVHQDNVELIRVRIVQQIMLQRVHVIDVRNFNVMQQHIGHAEQIRKRLFLDSVNAVIKLLLSRSIGYLLG
ncbi:unknown [Clostridium sp. CAG:138]|nr:unknown [Clostridium sp. CAG:138]